MRAFAFCKQIWRHIPYPAWQTMLKIPFTAYGRYKPVLGCKTSIFIACRLYNTKPVYFCLMPFIEKLVAFTTRRRLLSHILFWLGAYTLMMLSYFHDRRDPDPPGIQMIGLAFYQLNCMLYAYFLAYRILPGLIRSHKYVFILIEFVLGSYIIMVLARTVIVHVLEPLVRIPPFAQESFREILTDVPKLFFHYFIYSLSVSIIFLFFKLIKDHYLSNKRALSLEKQKAETELKSLKAQLNPHFLFNTLNNIYALSLTQSPQTSPAIARLSEILDYLLYRCSSLYVPLAQEITLLQNYIELEKLRYDSRLQVSFTHSVNSRATIAPLILLSLVENAFKHGAGEDAGSPRIAIDLRQQGKKIIFEVKNTYTPAAEKEDNLKIGLANMRQQLELVYPGTHTFTTHAGSDTYTARLEIILSNL